MKLKYMGMVGSPVQKEPKRLNALFWTDDGHQISVPADKDLERCCSSLKPEQEVDLAIAVAGLEPKKAARFAMPKVSETTKTNATQIAKVAVGCGLAMGMIKLAQLVLG